MCIKCLDCVLVVCRDKNDKGKMILSEGRQHTKPIQSGHLHIKKHKVWRFLLDRIHRRCSVTTFANNVHIGMIVQESADSFSHQWLVVNNQCVNLHTINFGLHSFRIW